MLEEKDLTARDLSIIIGRKIDFVENLLLGNAYIDIQLARRLADFSGVSPEFWLRRDYHYQVDRKGRKPTEEAEWISHLPVRDMIKFGWIEAADNFVGKISECLNFFSSTSVADWKATYGRINTAIAFRASQHFETRSGSVLTWLRQGKRLANLIACEPWRREKLQDCVPSMRALTRIKDPKVFLPELQKICAECGVALVVLPTPSGCPISGAVQFIDDAKAMMLLSFRYKTDDHFWFTFFHEIGHLILHKDFKIIVEGLANSMPHEEEEANEFSQTTLIPHGELEEVIPCARDFRKVARFAKKIGISPGIVIGQLQHFGIVPHSYLNALKVRYHWS